MNYFSIACIVSLLGVMGNTPALAESALTAQAKEVADRLEGVMDTSRQAIANPKAPNVRMTTCRVGVTSGEPGTIVLYQEQALSGQLGKPYRQRFLLIEPSAYSQSVRSLSFKPNDLTAWINFCDRPVSNRVLQKRDLTMPICQVFLRRSGQDYVGNTPVDGCPARVRGAVRMTNHVVLYTDGMDTWDREFDANGQQVWGAKADSYQFRKL